MLALWSRTLRSPGTCRCISCISNASTVTTRAGPVGVRGAWAFGTPTSTFFYTTIFAAGLAIDAKAKRNRNEQWDTVFASLREELRQTSPGGSADGIIREEDFISMPESIPEDLDWDTIYKVAGMELVEDLVFEQRESEMDAENVPEFLWDLLPLDAYPTAAMLEWPANTGPDWDQTLKRHYLPPQSLWSPQRMRLTAVRKQQTRKKLAIQELSVGLMIHNLLAHSKAYRSPKEALASLSPHIESVARYTDLESTSARREFLANIARLKEVTVEDWPQDAMSARISPKLPAEPYYFQDGDGDYHHIAVQLNAIIKSLLDEYNDKHSDVQGRALTVAKICHNLLISSSAPNLHTFNLLLTGFKKWNQPRLYDDVINALDECKIRPNEITAVAILDHYARTNRPDAFSKYVARMRAASDALMMADPNITINEKGQSRLVRVSEKKVYQKVYPTPIVFNALMHGVLNFAGFERAMDIYYEMKEDGWGLDMLGLSRFLDDCIHRADWQGGLLVWGEITNIRGRIKHNHLSKAYSQLLCLCSVTGNTAAFNSVLNDVVKRGFDRRVILKSAMASTNAARQREAYHAPAWTADNVLITVSEYMTGDKATESETAPFFEETDVVEPDPEKDELQESAPLSNDEAWAAWMEHELHEPRDKDRTGDS